MNDDLEVISWYRKILQSPPFINKAWTKHSWACYLKVKSPRDIKLLDFINLLISNGILVENGMCEINKKEYKSYKLNRSYRKLSLELLEGTDFYVIADSLFDLSQNKDKGTYVK